jgi:hypothetical protein
MQHVMMPIAIIGSFGASIYFFTKVLTDYILRKKMIEKGFVSPETQSIFKEQAVDNKFGALKWGLIIFSGGIALILMDFFSVQPDSTLPYGMFAVAVSLGYLAYYLIARKAS